MTMTLRGFLLAGCLSGLASSAIAQSLPEPVAAKPVERIERLSGHYVEGPGYVTYFHQQTAGYAGTYPECERNCLADARCRMIEFYKPLRKCHLYDHTRHSGKAPSADVGLKRPVAN